MSFHCIFSVSFSVFSFFQLLQSYIAAFASQKEKKNVEGTRTQEDIKNSQCRFLYLAFIGPTLNQRKGEVFIWL